MENIKIYGTSDEGTIQYLQKMLTTQFDNSVVKKFNNQKVVIVLPNAIEQILKDNNKVEKDAIIEYQKLNQDLMYANIVINLDVNLLKYNIVNITSSIINQVTVETDSNIVKLSAFRDSDIASYPNNVNWKLAPSFDNEIELLNSAMICDYRDVKSNIKSNKRLFKLILNNGFRFDVKNSQLFNMYNIFKPVEVCAIYMEYKNQKVYTCNFKKLDCKCFINIFSTISKTI